MPAVDSSFVILPRFTTLVGATTFTSLPQDVGAYGGAQFQIWRGPFRVKTPSPAATFTAYLEESLDTQTWVLGAAAPGAHVIVPWEVKFFAYTFRLRWFRLKIVITGDEPIVTCWAEGLLRGGGGGVWPVPTGGPAAEIFGDRLRGRAWPPLPAAVQARQDAMAYLQRLRQMGLPMSDVDVWAYMSQLP